MKRHTTILTILFLAMSSTAFSQQRPGPVLIDLGVDGKSRVYTVICPDGEQGSLDHRYEQGQFCIYPVQGDMTCIRTTDIDQAAARACSTQR